MNDADYFDACYDIGEDYLAHYGILGQKWGRRRYQNPDGTLTPLGRERLYDNSGKTKSIGGIANVYGEDFRYYSSSFPKNRLKRMMAAADSERRLNRLDYEISRKKHKNRDTEKLEEKRRKIAVNKDLYSDGLSAAEKAVGRAELYKRDQKIGLLVGVPLSVATTIGAMALRTYLPKLASTAISSVAPLIRGISNQVNKSPIMSTPLNEIEVPVKTWEDIFTEDEWNNVKTWKSK